MGVFERVGAIGTATLLLSACGGGGLPAKATVSMIDRTCDIVTTTTTKVDDPRGSGVKLDSATKDLHKGDCKSVAEWDEVRTKKKERISGTAIVHVDYQAPQDGSYHSTTLEFTGRDDEFYDLKAGDRIEIRVAKDDPARIWKA